MHADATMLCETLRDLRRKRDIDPEVSIIRDLQVRLMVDGRGVDRLTVGERVANLH